MKFRVRVFLLRVFEFILLSPFLGKIVKKNQRLAIYKKTAYTIRRERIGSKIFPDLKVISGPFKGLIYPNFTSFGSTLFPKLLGSYEMELWPIWEKFRFKGYSQILDIGCAEGYYAVGLARLFKDAVIYAYDTNPKAQNLCVRMSIINNVSERIRVFETLSSDELAKFPFNEHSLIISDCEGYEQKLFNDKSVKNLINTDIIIESHDFIDSTISSYLKSLFESTHNLITIDSISDNDKHLKFKVEMNINEKLISKRELLSEDRPDGMQWLIFIPRKVN